MHDSKEKSDHVIEQKEMPAELLIRVPELKSESVLDLTMKLRYDMLRQYLASGQLPEDAKDASIIIKLLDGMDKQDLTTKRLDIERDHASANSEIAKAALDLSRRLSGESNANPYERPVSGVVISSTPPKLDISLTQDIHISEGEKSESPRDFNRHPETGPVEED